MYTESKILSFDHLNLESVITTRTRETRIEKFCNSVPSMIPMQEMHKNRYCLE